MREVFFYMSDKHAISGFGTTISRAGNSIAEIVSIKPPQLKADTPDVTTMDSDTSYREFISTLKDGGEVALVLKFYIGDTLGQYGLISDFDNGTKQTFIITLPNSIATWTFNAYVTGYNPDIPLDDAVGLEITLKVTGKPVIGVTASTGWSAFLLRDSGDTSDATDLSTTPAVASSTTKYAVTFTTDSNAYPKVTASSHTIMLFIDDVFIEELTSGTIGSAIAFTAGQVKKLTVIAWEENKQPYAYQLMVTRTT